MLIQCIFCESTFGCRLQNVVHQSVVWQMKYFLMYFVKYLGLFFVFMNLINGLENQQQFLTINLLDETFGRKSELQTQPQCRQMLYWGLSVLNRGFIN